MSHIIGNQPPQTTAEANMSSSNDELSKVQKKIIRFDVSSTEEHRPMNDTTMPPPKSRLTTSTSSTVTTSSAPRKKVSAVNARGRFGLADWKRLLSSTSDLAQRKGQPLRRDITPQEVAQHNRPHDGWIMLRGRVYNISPYLAYHPGGASIFKSVLGKDATILFDKYHRWVSIDGLIGPLLLGSVRMGKSLPTITNPYNVVPTKEMELGNAPRIPVNGSVLYGSLMENRNRNDDDDDENEDDDDQEEEEDQFEPPSAV